MDQPVKIIFILVGILLIGWGVLNQSEDFIKKQTKWTSDFSGVKIIPTKQMTGLRKFMGIIFILLGIASLYTFFFV